jgi:hypothetical protein
MRNGELFMQDIGEALRYYLHQMRDGAAEHAFFGLLELGQEALPLLIAEAGSPNYRDLRANLVEVIWQYRQPEAVAFLGAALNDPDPAVWMQALDGLVVLGGPDAVAQVREALARIDRRGSSGGPSEEWLREALDQILSPESAGGAA